MDDVQPRSGYRYANPEGENRNDEAISQFSGTRDVVCIRDRLDR
jgi:hypothetical protein